MMGHAETQSTAEYTAEWMMRDRDEWAKENIDAFTFLPEQIIERLDQYKGVRPGPEGHGIYFLGLAEDIGYVGKALHLRPRLWTHWNSGREFSHYWCLTGMPKQMLSDLEGFYVQWLDPWLNKKPVDTCPYLEDLARELRQSNPWPAE